MPLIHRVLCVFCLASSLAATSPAPPTANPRPNVILITLDTVRADRMGFLGSDRKLTPNLDALARQSVVFTRAYSQVPLTTASHATILTGTYPQYHKVNDFGVPLAGDVPFAPAIFKSRGYHTVAFVGSLVLDPATRSAPGFDRGFDTFDAGFHRRRPQESRYQAIERRADEVVARASAWLNKQPRGPFFLWVHLYDAHDPYDPPEPYKTKYASNLYDGEVAYVDSAVGKFLTQLRTRGLFDPAVIAVLADHGEALGQHGESTHGIFLYDETIHVPLLFKLPAGRSAGKKIDSRVELVDVLPTLLRTAGLVPPPEMQGRSLLAVMRPPATKPGQTPAPVSDHPAYSESDYPHRTFGWSSLHALRAGKYLYIDSPRAELYDEASDPKEEHNISGTSVAQASTLSSQLNDFHQRTSSNKEAPQVTVDPELQEKLSALGYASDSSSAPMPGIKESGADPKDKVEVVNLLHDAEIAKEEMHFQEAVPLLERVITLEPNLPIAYLQLGTALSSVREYDKALPILRKAVEMRPDLIIPRYQLGSALFETGEFAAAAIQFETATSRSPDWPEAHFSLATAYARMDRLPDAIKEYEKVIQLRPNHYAGHLLLGRALALSGDPAAAIPKLTKAATLQPKSPEPHNFLADAYEQLGKTADEQRERAEAERLKTNSRR